jgi:hypothetical protein
MEAHDKTKAKSAKSITWYGIDFTSSKFTLVTEDPAVIVNQYLKSINTLIQAEPEKFDLRKWFNKTEVSYDLEQAIKNNEKINPENIVTSNDHSITTEDAKAVVAHYKTSGKSGLGLIFIAENLNKVKQTGSYYVCFFDEATKEIIDINRYEAKAVGIGFRNYWAGSVYNVMKIWLK